MEAVLSDDDRALAEKLFDLLEALDVSYGTHDDFWFGTPPRGAVFFHPFGYRYPPISLWVNKSGQLMASGSWTKYPHVVVHDGFAELAVFLGQNHRA